MKPGFELHSLATKSVFNLFDDCWTNLGRPTEQNTINQNNNNMYKYIYMYIFVNIHGGGKSLSITMQSSSLNKSYNVLL